ncbi:class I SAM-dependent methyltransferase [Actinomyces naeslundii]|uniref:class I SAM-dependent methyltransferase n=1 Tax=Actinomyces naeslundii TaxID=1655 RepID=UPI00094C0954|nr:class I SAM-dependent methyltransferase [Actinomyces naeslundii]OLO82342.1 SAM-dependent methyltransferase [Actinomyces naeslundii]OMG12073.1 SAM-dependent methyltransferase [Actinomyces naeslundii]
MDGEQYSDTSGGSAGAARYTHGHGAAVLSAHSRRGAEDSAAYLLPHLNAGMDLLDVGCGPATITADLAGRVAPGRVVGLDTASGALEAARATLAERDLPARVELTDGDVMSLPFDDGTFDVAHAHQVLQHLSDPVGALAEMRRVTRPGGIVAVRDAVYSAMAWYPEPEGMKLWRSVYMATARANGGEPDAGGRLLAWARRAGFAEVTASASTWCYATAADRAWQSETWAQRCLTSFGPQAVELGLARRDDLETMAHAWRQWGGNQDAWFVVVHGEVIARA